ncbi:hypothetical protein J25TS5_37090 [Paenibacillus faecis]|nr:hypothetical protein J25TS5_37090 [Paenibacillus faecis]
MNTRPILKKVRNYYILERFDLLWKIETWFRTDIAALRTHWYLDPGYLVNRFRMNLRIKWVN